MSDSLAAAASATGVPEELLMRAAQARAEVQGVSADDILGAWGGGAPVPVVAAPAVAAPAAVATPEPAVVEVEPEAPAPVETPAVAAVAVLEAEPVPVVEPETLGARVGAGLRVGAVMGTVFGLVLAVLAAPLVFDSLNAIQDDAGTRIVAELQPLSVVIAIAALSAIFGGLVARAAVLVPPWIRPGLAVATKPGISVLVGAVTGLLLGLVGAGVLLGGLSEESALEGHVAVNIIGAVVLAFIGGSILGAVTGAITQALARPQGVTGSDLEASEVVRRRLNTAYATPLMVVGGIAALVVSLGVLLVALPSAAPFIAIVAAGSILGMAALAASGSARVKVGATEFFVAAAGVGSIILLIALVFDAQGGGHG